MKTILELSIKTETFLEVGEVTFCQKEIEMPKSSKKMKVFTYFGEGTHFGEDTSSGVMYAIYCEPEDKQVASLALITHVNEQVKTEIEPLNDILEKLGEIAI